jgi:protein-S-isoprenylcysteine O-methyltransferase Ste14
MINIEIIFLIDYLAIGVILHVLSQGKKFSKKENSVKKLHNILNILNFIPGYTLIPALLFFTYELATKQFEFNFVPILSPLNQLLGLMLLSCGLWLYNESFNRLKRLWSTGVELRKKHKVVRTGIYKLIRHPIYTAWFCIALSQTLLFQKSIFLVLFGMIFVWYFYRAKIEEKFLSSHLKEYKDYLKKSKMFIPKVF